MEKGGWNNGHKRRDMECVGMCKGVILKPTLNLGILRIINKKLN